MSSFESYACLVRWIFKRGNSEVTQQLPLCCASASKLISIVVMKDYQVSDKTLTAAANLVG